MTKAESTLERVILRMTESLDLGDVLTEITRAMVEELDAALARVWLVTDDDDAPPAAELRLVASAGLSESLTGRHGRIAVGALKIGRIAATRESVVTNDLAHDPRIEDKAWVAREGLASFAGYALLFRGALLGVLGMFARRPLLPAEFERLETFAAHASVAIQNARLYERLARLSRRLEVENRTLKDEIGDAPSRDQASEIIGQSAPLLRAVAALDRVAPTSSTVLLFGETGTGKELFARALHARSQRRAQPLVRVNLAAISPGLLESELFGHERGAFTGATQRRIGRFELADGGTLFIDEIGELPLDTQVKLLRVLQERELERVGGGKTIHVDVRVVCATNRDLAAAVRTGAFRADLYYRLNVFPITIPPLRERKGDVPLLAVALLASIGKRLGRSMTAIDDEALRHLEAHDWPGNVRELHNVLERAAILAREPHLTLADLPDFGVTDAGSQRTAPDDGPSADTAGLSLRQRVDAYERSVIEACLRRAGGNQSEAARLLRTSRATLQYKMKALGLG